MSFTVIFQLASAKMYDFSSACNPFVFLFVKCDHDGQATFGIRKLQHLPKGRLGFLRPWKLNIANNFPFAAVWFWSQSGTVYHIATMATPPLLRHEQFSAPVLSYRQKTTLHWTPEFSQSAWSSTLWVKVTLMLYVWRMYVFSRSGLIIG